MYFNTNLYYRLQNRLKIPKSTIDHHIQCFGLIKKLDIWIPHGLKEIHLTKRINACDLHLKAEACFGRPKSTVFCEAFLKGNK